MAKKKASKKSPARKAHKKSAPKMTKAEMEKRFPHLLKQSETPRPAGLPHHRAKTPHARKPLHQLSENRLHFLMYVCWKGYTIARYEKPGPERDKRLKYYAEGVDKIKAEFTRRGIKDKRHHDIDIQHKAKPFPTGPTAKHPERKKFPRYADGIWLTDTGTDKGKLRIISPLNILINAKKD